MIHIHRLLLWGGDDGDADVDMDSALQCDNYELSMVMILFRGWVGVL